MRGGVRANGDGFRLAIRLPTADSLCSLKVARASKISGRKFSAAARRSLRALTSAELVIGKASRRPVMASSSPRSIRSQRESAVGRRSTRRGVVPVCPKTATARLRRHDQQLRSPFTSHRGRSPRWRRSRDSASRFSLSAGISRSFHSSGNGDLLRLLARGDSAVWVGARSEG